MLECLWSCFRASVTAFLPIKQLCLAIYASVAVPSVLPITQIFGTVLLSTVSHCELLGWNHDMYSRDCLRRNIVKEDSGTWYKQPFAARADSAG